MSQELMVADRQYDQKTLDLIRTTFCKGINEDQFRVFIYSCQKIGLDPLMKQVYAVSRWDAASKTHVMAIQTSIDGYRCIAERTGRYVPGKSTEYVYDANGQLVSATAFVKKLAKDGSWHEVCATAFYREYVQTTKEGMPNKFWSQMPHNQLGKCAEALALRKAFPADLSGIYTKEEMEQADNVVPLKMETVEAEEIKTEPEKKYVTEEQANELKNALLLCAEEFASNCQSAYFSSCGIDCWEKLEERFFNKLIARVYASVQAKPVEAISA